MRLLDDLRELRRQWRELFEMDEASDRKARYDLALSARRFSRKTQRAVDDKLSFSATLMRAGEVEAAQRLLGELERDLRAEEAALLESVNEAKLARRIRHDRITRLRLARTLAAASIGATLLATSALGIAVAGLFQDRRIAPPRVANVTSFRIPRNVSRLPVDTRKLPGGLRRVALGRGSVVLTESELRMVSHLASGAIDQSQIAQLLALLPADLAAEFERVLAAVAHERARGQGEVDQVVREGDRNGRKRKKDHVRTDQPQPSPAPEPTESPQEPKPTSSPEPEEDEDPDGSGGPDAESPDELDEGPLPPIRTPVI